MIPHIAGVVLCGGESSRMGRPKAWLPVGGEAMLARVVRLVGAVASPVVVVAARGQQLPALPLDTLIALDPIEMRGPLQGLVAGLSVLDGTEAAYLSSCDVPLLLPEFIRRMASLLGEYTIVVPEIAGRLHPLAGVYRTQVIAAAERLLASDVRKMTRLFDEVPTRIVREEELIDIDADFRSLRNVNTQEEYDDILAMIDTAT